MHMVGYGLSGITDEFPLGDTQEPLPVGDLAAWTAAGGSVSGTTIVFPANTTDEKKTYMINHWVVGSGSATILRPTIIQGDNISFKQGWADNTGFDAGYWTSMPLGAYTRYVFLAYVTVAPHSLPPEETFIQFGDDGTMPIGTTYGNLYIMEVNAKIA